MAKRHRVRGSAPAGQPFDYSKAEWEEIEAAIAAVRGGPISEKERSYLCAAAEYYRRDCAKRAAGKYASPMQKTKARARVAKLCEQLRDALETAGGNRDIWVSGGGDQWRSQPVLLDGDEWLTLGDLVGVLAKVQEHFSRRTDLGEVNRWRLSITGRFDPPVVFQQVILRLWTVQFGGRLTITRDPVSNEISGPLARYFLAVARPVMGERTPSPQSLPDIVKRQKMYAEKEERAQEYVARIRRRARGFGPNR